MKKILLILMSLAILCICGCKSNNNTSSSSAISTAESSSSSSSTVKKSELVPYPDNTWDSEESRRPSDPSQWPIVPTAGYWGDTNTEGWMLNHKKLVDMVVNYKYKQELDVLLVGDSITAQWSTTDPLILNNQWKEAFPNLKTLNIGIGGDKIQNIAFRVKYNGVIDLNPKVIVLMAGTNNCYYRETPVAAINNGIKECAILLSQKCPNATIVIVNLLPGTESGSAFFQFNQQVADGFKDIDFGGDKRFFKLDIRKKFLNSDGSLNNALFKQDKLHLSPEGYGVWAAELKPLLTAILGN